MKSRYENKAINEDKVHEKEVVKETKEEKVERSFTFPSHNLVIKATSLEEATKKFHKIISKDDNKE